jgi:hypothetical protein
MSPILTTGAGSFPIVAGALPVATWQFSGNSSASTQNQSWSGTIGVAVAQRFIMLGLAGSALATTITSLTVTPNVGTARTASLVIADAAGAGRRAAIYSCVLLADADTATTVTVDIVYSTNPFGTTVLHLWTAPSGNMSSQTATGSSGIQTPTVTTTSTTINTSAGGFIIAVGSSSVNPNATSDFSGSTETITQRNNSSAVGISSNAGDANNVAANASSTVTVNYGTSSTIRIATAAWR